MHKEEKKVKRSMNEEEKDSGKPNECIHSNSALLIQKSGPSEPNFVLSLE